MEEANEFVRDNGTDSFPMLYDSSGVTWASMSVVAQPAWMVVAPDGRLTEGSYGEIPEDRVAELAKVLNDL